MLVRCPNPACNHEFEVKDSASGKNGPCPTCSQIITFRPKKVWKQIHSERSAIQNQIDQTGANSPINLSAILVDIRSLFNVGSIFRTADGAGFQKLYLCGITGTPPRKEIKKTSLGAEEAIAWEYQQCPLSLCTTLKENGTQLIAMECNEKSKPLSESLNQLDLSKPIALLLGNEVAGVSEELQKECALACHLPMRGIKHSLNVSVAFGIAAYTLADAVYSK